MPFVRQIRKGAFGGQKAAAAAASLRNAYAIKAVPRFAHVLELALVIAAHNQSVERFPGPRKVNSEKI
jgi:hypothetical protein